MLDPMFFLPFFPQDMLNTSLEACECCILQVHLCSILSAVQPRLVLSSLVIVLAYRKMCSKVFKDSYIIAIVNSADICANKYAK